jgi:CRP-like cAMP-binding protein
MKQDDEIVTKRSQLELVHSYLAHIDVSADLKANVEQYFQARLKDASFSSVRDDDIAASMPIALQIEVSKHTNRSLVGQAALLRGCSDAFVDRLSSLLRERALEPETQLFREGEACRELFFIGSGSVELTASAGGAQLDQDQDEQLTIAVSGETVGELSFIFGIRHFKNGRTASGIETHVFVLTTDSYRLLLKTFPQQEDRVMDNAMFQFDGARAPRAREPREPLVRAPPRRWLTRLERERAPPLPAMRRDANQPHWARKELGALVHVLVVGQGGLRSGHRGHQDGAAE